VPEKVHLGVGGFIHADEFALAKALGFFLAFKESYWQVPLEQHQVRKLRVFGIVAAITLSEDIVQVKSDLGRNVGGI
jgi:hypothetical protein